MIAQVSSAAQTEMSLGRIDGGTYRIGRNVAVWKTRANNSHIIDLSFRQRRYKITKESRGPQGHGRLFVNGFRQPDGKLLQGRELLELIRKIDRFHENLIKRQLDRIETTMHVRFDQIEKAIVRTKWRRPAGKGKLCTIPITATWTQERYVPKSALGGFSRVPLPVIHASQEMAAGEYRLLQAILFCAQGTGLLTAGKKRLAKLAAVDPADVKHFLRSLCNRALIHPTGSILKSGIREYELLTHPWFVDPLLTQGEETREGWGKETRGGGEETHKREGTVPPLKTNKTITDKTTNKSSVLAPDGEQELLDQIRQICGEKEVRNSGGQWINLIRKGSDSLRGVRAAIEDWKLVRPDLKGGIKKSRGAWLRDRYNRFMDQVRCSNESWRKDKAKDPAKTREG